MEIENYHSFYLFTFFRSFLPLTVFMTPYLIEEKGSRNNQIYNGVHPTFFISSSIFTLIFPSIVSSVASNSILYFIIIMEIFYSVIFLLMPKGQYLYACLAAICHSFSTAAMSLGSKIILNNFIPTGPNTKDSARKITATNTTMKKIPAVLSAFLAQNIFFQANKNRPNVISSLFSMVIPILVIPFIKNFNFSGQKNLIVRLFTGGLGDFLKLYNKDIVFYSAMSIITSTFSMCFAIYSQNIFYERKKNSTPSPTLYEIVNFISKFFSFFAKGFLFLYNYTQSEESKVEEQDNIISNKKFLYGYVDGASKIFASIISLFFTNYVRHENAFYNQLISVAVIFLLISLTFLMGRVNSLLKTYMLFIAATMVIQAANDSIIADFRNLCIANNSSYASFITFNMFIDSLIHITISYGTKMLGLNVSKKLYAYFIVSIPLLAAAIYCMF